MGGYREAHCFDTFRKEAQLARQAARLVGEAMERPAAAGKLLARLDPVEAAAAAEHTAVTELADRALITPLERDDIVELSQSLCRFPKLAHSILLWLQAAGIRQTRRDGVTLAGRLDGCMEAVQQMVEEFPQFRKGRRLRGCICRVEETSGGARRCGLQCAGRLLEGTGDPRRLLAWLEMYRLLDQWGSLCEEVARQAARIAVRNG